LTSTKLDKEKLKRIFKQMETDAITWNVSWKELRDYINPTKGMFTGDQANDGTKIDHQTILDGTPMLSNRTMAAGMTSGHTSASQPWFKLKTGIPELDKIKSVEVWLSNVREIMMGVFQKSNFYESIYSVHDEIGTFGTAAMLISEDDEDTIRCHVYTIGEYYLLVDSKGRVHGFGRRFHKNVEQMVEEFGIENVSPQVKISYNEGRYGNNHKVIHLILKNDKKEYGKIDNRNMTFMSVYWEDGGEDNSFLEIGGFEEFPVMAPRWQTKHTNSTYGTAPGWESLGDAKMLQKEWFSLLVGVDKVLDPPMQVDNSVQGEANFMAGGIVRTGSTLPNAGVKPAYQIKPETEAGHQIIQDTRLAIKRYFYYDLFLMLASSDGKQRTAREVHEMHEEKFLTLGAVLGRLQKELLSPVIDRTFGIIARNGMLPIPPPELRGKQLKIEYISILAQAQKMVGTASIEQVTMFVSNAAQIAPESVDVVNFDEAITEYGEKHGVNPRLIRSPQEIKLIRAQRQRAQQQQAAAEQSSVAVQEAKALSETKIGQNSALDKTLAAVQGGES
jgi:hypothetical protein